MQTPSATPNAPKESYYKTARARIACAHFAKDQIVAVEYYGKSGEYGEHYFKCAATRENLAIPEKSAVYPMKHLTDFVL